MLQFDVSHIETNLIKKLTVELASSTSCAVDVIYVQKYLAR